MATYKSQARCVAQGAARLDKKVPGWHRMIDTDTLRLSNGYYCIAGQLGRKLHPSGFRRDGFMDMAKRISPFRISRTNRYGFTTDGSYDHLTQLWQTEIRRRLDADRQKAEADRPNTIKQTPPATEAVSEKIPAAV